MIGVSRWILDSMLSQISPSHFTHKVLSTFVAEVSAIINARPLTPITMDADSPCLPTPPIIMTQKVCTPLPPPGSFENADLYSQQWKCVQHWKDGGENISPLFKPDASGRMRIPMSKKEIWYYSEMLR